MKPLPATERDPGGYLYADVALKRGSRGACWIVLRCPFCFNRHTHRAGAPGEEPHSKLGLRYAHCDISRVPRTLRLALLRNSEWRRGYMLRWNGSAEINDRPESSACNGAFTFSNLLGISSA
jgi:hypothetical protein